MQQNKPVIQLFVNDELYNDYIIYTEYDSIISLNISYLHNDNEHLTCNVLFDDSNIPLSYEIQNDKTLNISVVFDNNNLKYKISLFFTDKNLTIVDYKDFYFYTEKVGEYIEMLNEVQECVICNSEIKNNWNFCAFCGTKIKNEYDEN